MQLLATQGDVRTELLRWRSQSKGCPLCLTPATHAEDVLLLPLFTQTGQQWGEAQPGRENSAQIILGRKQAPNTLG